MLFIVVVTPLIIDMLFVCVLLLYCCYLLLFVDYIRFIVIYSGVEFTFHLKLLLGACCCYC
jgi:hypothetical protein